MNLRASIFAVERCEIKRSEAQMPPRGAAFVSSRVTVLSACFLVIIRRRSEDRLTAGCHRTVTSCIFLIRREHDCTDPFHLIRLSLKPIIEDLCARLATSRRANLLVRLPVGPPGKEKRRLAF